MVEVFDSEKETVQVAPKVIKLACPLCGGTIFENFYVYQPPTFADLGFSNDFFYTTEKCVNCGWTSVPTEPEEARRYLSAAFRIAPIIDPEERARVLREYGFETFNEAKENA